MLGCQEEAVHECNVVRKKCGRSVGVKQELGQECEESARNGAKM